jgi:hypothetical protein
MRQLRVSPHHQFSTNQRGDGFSGRRPWKLTPEVKRSILTRLAEGRKHAEILAIHQFSGLPPAE